MTVSKNTDSKNDSENWHKKIRFNYRIMQIITIEVKISHAQDKDGDNNKSRVSISIIPDSLIKHTARSSISRNNNVSILSHSGATTDLIDYVKLSICKKPDVTIAHIGTTDLIKEWIQTG